MLRTKFDEHKHYYCSSGSRYENTYQEQINKKSGSKELVKVGKTCVYDIIQSDFESTKIENILHKLAMGDFSVLKQAELTYVDEKDFPKDLMEAQNIVVKAKAEFDKFPTEVKELFHNSPEEYVSEIGTDDFIKKMSPYNDSIKKRQEKEDTEKFNAAVAEQVAFNKAVNEAMGKEENN